MKKIFIYVVFSVSFLLIGFFAERIDSYFNVSKENPVYEIVSATVLDERQAKKYYDAAAPLAEDAGVELVASGEPFLLEGQWEFQGEKVHIIRYRSESDMMKFWNSDAYKEAKKLRENAISIDFILAVVD